MGKNREEVEGEFEARVRMEQRQRSSRSGRTSSIALRAPQENYTLDDFDFGKLYGIGSYSKVIMAKKKDTGNVYALKIMDKRFITKENKAARVKLERLVLDQLDHPGVIKLFFTFQDNNSLYMALESCEGGELFDQINRKGRLSEDEARFYAAEVIDTLEYIHGLGLIHQDIKPENLLLSAEGHIKIADFGSVTPTNNSRISVLPEATKAKADDKACAFVGTAAYVPPEALNSSPATFGNDLWALGCTLYQMLSGTSPFKDATDWLIYQRIVTRDISFPEYFSDEASDLIDKLLDKDPQKRLGVGLDGYAALKFHPFFKGIKWKSIWTSSPPELAGESNANNGNSDADAAQDNRWNHQQSVREGNRNSGTASSVSSTSFAAALSSVGSFDSKWQGFLDYGESIIMISAVKKLNKLRTKKVQLILTDKPKLVCAENSKVEKMKLLWSDDPKDLTVQVSNSKNFKICTPGKVRSFEDPKERAWQWKKAVESLINKP